MFGDGIKGTDSIHLIKDLNDTTVKINRVCPLDSIGFSLPNSFHLEGINAFDKHDYQTAKTLFLQSIEKNPEEADSYLFLGKSYFFCDEKSEAIVHLKKYIVFLMKNKN
jgi:hypothetical protein